MTPVQQQPERPHSHDQPAVPIGMQVAAAWAWRVGLVLVVSAMLLWLLGQISLLVIPLMVAALFSALLMPVVKWLRRVGVPQGLAVAATLVGLIALVLGGLFLAGRQMVTGIASLSQQAVKGLIQIQDWLTAGPLGLSNDQIDSYLAQALDALQNNSSAILSQALGIGSSFGHFAAGLLLTVFVLIFYLLEGERIWEFLIRFFPRRARPAVDGAGRRGWLSLGNYVRVQILVAAVDAVGIGAGAAIIQVPLALPLGVLVFVGSFIPVVGALVTGAVAVLLALVANGWVNALIMLGIVLLVQQLESHLLQPFVMGRAVSLHPVAVIMAVAAGSTVAGILGALFAVPVLAVANSFIRYIAGRGWDTAPGARDLDVPPSAPPSPAAPEGGQERRTDGPASNARAVPGTQP
ncbi:AI-2E family transporter [Arthrobacter sp. STN4]|uniref:AI-2E family transporter n=1 Tax=Arthrobacter sp. STN4 TaxID=2923276 RepID=UPI002119F663|nr:AI-2E family transporter [Arthrobacter sp. STN4]MCQ9163540.1 AI-2E family transporter [Arthrobacter sp. STN4]